MIKENVSIAEANHLLHSLAATLTEEGQTRLYDAVQDVRSGVMLGSGDPRELVKQIVAVWMKFFEAETAGGKAE